MTIWFKACPRCSGNIKIAADMYGRYRQCLQCGFMEDLPEGRPSLVEGLTEAKQRKRTARAA